MRRGGTRDIERTVKVHVEDRLPFVDGHVEEHPITHDPGIVDHAIDTTEGIDGGLDEGRGSRGVGKAGGVGAGWPARRGDLSGHLLRGPRLAGPTHVVDDDLGAVCRERQREITADAAARAGHDHYLVLHHGAQLLNFLWPISLSLYRS